MKIYISGPITGTDDYMERFEKAEKALKAAGYTTINPAVANSYLPANTTHEEYMRTSIAMLSMCDGIYMMSGWKKSKGCVEEITWAVANQITCIFEEKMQNQPENCKKSAIQTIKETCNKVCDDLCKYASTSDANYECDYIREHGNCPLDTLNGWS